LRGAPPGRHRDRDPDHRALPAAPGRLQTAPLRPVRARPAQDLHRQGDAPRAEDPRRLRSSAAAKLRRVNSAATSARRIAAGAMIAVVLALVIACAGHPQPPPGQPPAAKPTTRDTPSARPVTSTPSPAVVVGVPGHYRVEI